MISGIGGIFLVADDAPALARWYGETFEISTDDGAPPGAFAHHFPSRDEAAPETPALLVWAIFPREAGQTRAPGSFTINSRVRDMDALLAKLRARDVAIARTESHEYGKFAWLRDPEGNEIELYEDATTMNQSENTTPHPEYDDLRTALGDNAEGNAALDDLHAAMHDPKPQAQAVQTHVDRLRGIPAIEAKVAIWFESPRTQNFMEILNNAGL